jgi:hypothetical protein
MAWSPHGKILLAGFTTGEIAIWDGMAAGRHEHGLLHANANSHDVPCAGRSENSVLASHVRCRRQISAVAWGPDGSQFAAVVTHDGFQEVFVWAVTGEFVAGAALVRTDLLDSRIMQITWSPDGSKLAASMDLGEVVVIDATTCLPHTLIEVEGAKALARPAADSAIPNYVPNPTTLAQIRCLTGLRDHEAPRPKPGPGIAWGPGGIRFLQLSWDRRAYLRRIPMDALIEDCGKGWPDGVGPREVDVVTDLTFFDLPEDEFAVCEPEQRIVSASRGAWRHLAYVGEVDGMLCSWPAEALGPLPVTSKEPVRLEGFGD